MLITVGHSDLFSSDGPDTFQKLEIFLKKHPGAFLPGYLCYDLKNEIEGTKSERQNDTGFPHALFFIPEQSLVISGSTVYLQGEDPETTLADILSLPEEEHPVAFKGTITPKMTREEYGAAFRKLQEHIFRGDIYEANLCQEFYAAPAALNPFAAYQKLNTVSPTPYSCFFKHKDFFIISASPERFLAKRGEKLISQPIKGTAPRGKSFEEDESIKAKLKANPKEISENIMIVDLVRNDLTRSAKAGSVQVEELLGLYSFHQVHQLISTITCSIHPQTSAVEAIKNTFPAGSMTGAPKISAMKIIEENEFSKRGVYAGALGYFGPDGDFDFNVVIRTLVYNARTRYLSYHVGGAITALAEEDQEYEECLLKASAINALLAG